MKLSIEPDVLAGYAGVYYSEDLDYSLELVVKDAALHAVRRNGLVKLEPRFTDLFEYGRPMQTVFLLHFVRSESGEVESFLANNDRAMNIRFVRQQ